MTLSAEAAVQDSGLNGLFVTAAAYQCRPMPDVQRAIFHPQVTTVRFCGALQREHAIL